MGTGCAQCRTLAFALEAATDGLATALELIAVSHQIAPMGEEADADRMILDGATLLHECRRALDGKDSTDA